MNVIKIHNNHCLCQITQKYLWNSSRFRESVLFFFFYFRAWKVNKMALSNILILSQIAGHVIVLTLSMCIIIPMLHHVNDFNGHCLLFTTGTWSEDNGLFDVKWGSKFFCDFTIITGFFLFLVSSIEIYR